MSIDLGTIREAICTTLKRQMLMSTSWFPYVVPLQSGVNYPAGVVDYQRDGADIVYYNTFDGTGTVLLDIELHVRASPVDAQKQMDRYMSTGLDDVSVKDAIEADPTLGGLVMSCDVTGTEVGPIPTDDAQDYIARIHLTVMP